LLGAAYVLVVLGVAVSRVYLGVHWLTDVLGSLSAGMGLLGLWGVIRLTSDRRGLTEPRSNDSTIAPPSPDPSEPASFALDGSRESVERRP
jgi:membrane-associated phospholipid phosphatase